MRRRHDRVPDRRSPGKLGGPLPGQQRHRGQAPLRQADQGQPLPGRCADRVCLGCCPKPRHLSGRPAAGGWPGASASRKAAIAVGHSILVIAWQLLSDDCDYADLGGDFFIRRDADRARQRALTQLQASATRSPSNPPPNTRGFSFQDSTAPEVLSRRWSRAQTVAGIRQRRSRRGSCQRFARNCATRNLTSPHAPTPRQRLPPARLRG
jgi:hypothetical protein